MSIHGPRLRIAMVDTSASFALLDRRDDNHHAARRIAEQIAVRRIYLIAPNFLIAETHALILNKLGHATASAFLDRIDQGSIRVERIDVADEQRARDIIRQYKDKDFSLTDATSFAVMERLDIHHAFAFDHHFQQFGFTLLSDVL